jgi:L-amino acid N-acyltransferase YncA
VIEIRSVRPDEFTRFRELRLRSLKDSPDVYGSSWEAEGLMGIEAWKQWVAERPERKVLVAEENGEWLGTATCSPYQGKADALGLFAIWVAPAQRRTGLARRLVQAQLSFAAGTSRKRMLVHVAETNEPARKMFAALGFQETGERHRLREDLPVDAIVLQREITAQA